MNRRLLVLLCCAIPAIAAADDRQSIVGVWRYVGEVDTKADGTPAPAAALSDTQGLLIYTADGYMSVVHMPTGRAWLAETASASQLRETVTNGNAYAGRYELDPVAHTITHITQVSMEPAYQGKRLVRGYALEGNMLKLSGSFPFEGAQIHFTISFVRVAGKGA